MAPALIHRAERSSAPGSIEEDLVALWRDVASQGPIARAVMSNLIVFRLRERRSRRTQTGAAIPSEARDESTLDAVIAKHPSRTIVLEHNRGDAASGALTDAEVSVSIFGTPAAAYGVEKIRVRSCCDEASLPSLVRRFVRGDLPTSVWWTEDLSRVRPLPEVVVMARQLVFDSRQWRDVRDGIRALAPAINRGRVDLADLNWQRLTPLREALAHVAASLRGDVAPHQIHIEHAEGERPLAWLLAGWLASRLSWPTDGWPAIDESGDESLILTIDVETAPLTLRMNDHRVLIEQQGVAPLVAAVPQRDEGEAVAVELRSLSRDVALHDALVALVERVVQS